MTDDERTQRVREALPVLYAALDAEIAAAAPVCELSGRCCRFREYGHTLFLSRPEAEFLLETPLPAGAVIDESGCPYQVRGMCTARDRRPLGCRVYFCDPRFAQDMPVLSELYLARLKELHDASDVAWDYRPLHCHLQALLTRDGSPTNDSGANCFSPAVETVDPEVSVS